MPEFKTAAKKMICAACPSCLNSYISSSSDAQVYTPSTKRYAMFLFPPPSPDIKTKLHEQKHGLVRHSSDPLMQGSVVPKHVICMKTSGKIRTLLPRNKPVIR